MELLREAYGDDVVHDLASPAVYRRGLQYHLEGRVRLIVEEPDRCVAIVAGTHDYDVELFGDGDDIDFACDCPRGDDGDFCKHCVAVALEVLTSASRPRPRPAASSPQPDRMNRQDVDRVLDPDMYDPYDDEWESACFDIIEGIVDDIEMASTASELAETAAVVMHAIEVARRARRQDLMVEAAVEELVPLHLRACRGAHVLAAGVEPTTRRRWVGDLVELLGDIGPEWVPIDVQGYLEVLGDIGISAVVDALDDRWEQAIESRAGQREIDRAREARTRLARASGDVDDVIDVALRDLHDLSQYEMVAHHLKTAGRRSEAIEWARRGLERFPTSWSSTGLRNQLIRWLEEEGDTHAVIDLRRSGFERRPTADDFRKWFDVVDPADRSHVVEEALAILGDPATTAWSYGRVQIAQPGPPGVGGRGNARSAVTVEVCLIAGDHDRAWRCAVDGGCNYETWLALAESRRNEHPDDAIAVYEVLIDALADMKNNKAYDDAAQLAGMLRDVAIANGRPDVFDAFMVDLQARHGRKRNLMLVLDRRAKRRR